MIVSVIVRYSITSKFLEHYNEMIFPRAILYREKSIQRSVIEIDSKYWQKVRVRHYPFYK